LRIALRTRKTPRLCNFQPLIQGVLPDYDTTLFFWKLLSTSWRHQRRGVSARAFALAPHDRCEDWILTKSRAASAGPWGELRLPARRGRLGLYRRCRAAVLANALRRRASSWGPSGPKDLACSKWKLRRCARDASARSASAWGRTSKRRVVKAPWKSALICGT